MLTKKFVLIAVIFSFLVAPMSMLRAQDPGALLDLLVRKKLITDQEAEEVRAELTKEAATTSGGKWKLSSPITEIKPTIIRRWLALLMVSQGKMIGRNASASVIVSASASAARWWTIGSSVCVLKPTPAGAQPT